MICRSSVGIVLIVGGILPSHGTANYFLYLFVINVNFVRVLLPLNRLLINHHLSLRLIIVDHIINLEKWVPLCILWTFLVGVRHFEI